MTAMHEAMAGAPGLIARRQAGAGFGGCLVALVERDAVAAFSDAVVARAYAAATGIEPRIFAVRSASALGAGPLDSSLPPSCGRAHAPRGVRSAAPTASRRSRASGRPLTCASS